jgi:peptidoglycan biosynthesis protein MviN/MurJ (putative lipid II flippase)
MGLVLWWSLPWLQSWLSADNLLARATVIVILVTLGGSVYLLTLILLKVQELALLFNLIRPYLPKR